MSPKRRQIVSILFAAVCLLLISAFGCQKPDDGMSTDQAQKADRLTEIAKKADGDWTKVPPADQDYIKKTFTSGDEAGAKMLVLTKSGKFHGGPGGGGPGGPQGRPGGAPAPAH